MSGDNHDENFDGSFVEVAFTAEQMQKNIAEEEKLGNGDGIVACVFLGDAVAFLAGCASTPATKKEVY